MYEQEKRRTTHLMILICNTLFMIALAGESAFLGWEAGAVVLLFLGLGASWMVHITERMTESIRLWLHIILSMLIFYFYGIHESGIYEMAPIMTVIILLYTDAEECVYIRVCALTYYLTMCYDFVFVLGNPMKLPTYTLARLLLHFLLVFMAARLAETMIQRRLKEREMTDEQISRLEESNRRVEDFLTNVSHELRTPINVVTGITTVMMKNEKDPRKKKELLSIQMAGNRLFGQIEDILDYTEVDTGKVIVSEENYMLSSLINDIIVESRLMKNENKLELIFDVDASFPLTLLGDGRKIKKIIKHLIDNAMKFTKTGGVYVRVYALQKGYGINLCIKVSDTGVGIAEEELEKITERFFQSNGGRNRKAGGLGLGLSIVHGMVTVMGGFMQIESKEGKGTTVSVSIPQKVVDDTPSMEVPNRRKLCIGLYLRPEKYEVPEVRAYYNAVTSHMVQELDLTVHKVFEQGELKRLVAAYRLTHLVIGKEEYEENVSYFDTLDKEMEIIVVADDSFMPTVNSRVNIVRKPFYCLPIVNILNAQSSMGIDDSDRENMLCPGVKVLVVDDEPMNLIVAEGIFKAYRMEVKTAGSGMEAVELCRNEEFDLIFLDHMMPEMDGVETLKLLRKTETDAGKAHTIIAFTANAVSGAREMFLQEGFDEFISKPIEDQELRRLLRKVLPKTSIVYAGEYDSVKSYERKPALENVREGDKLVRLEERGFHTENGLQYSHNDREFYEKLLLMFAKNSESKMADIEASFRTESIKEYQILVHALKSSSKMIGADLLSKMAKNAEEAAKNQDAEYIRENHEALMGKYRETAQNIFEVVSFDKADLSEADFTSAAEVSKEELLRRLSELKKSLDIFEVTAAEAALKDMSGFIYQGTLVRELLRDVGQDVENFELSAAAEKAGKIIDSMEGGEV